MDEWIPNDDRYDDPPTLMVASPAAMSTSSSTTTTPGGGGGHHDHDHASDPDETDDESVRPRIRSFGDAEDFLNNKNGTFPGLHYYESFVLPSPPPDVAAHNTNALHHRSRHAVTSTPQNDLYYKDDGGSGVDVDGGGDGSEEDEDESPRHRLLRQFPSLRSKNNHHHYHGFSYYQNLIIGSGSGNKRPWMSPMKPTTGLYHHLGGGGAASSSTLLSPLSSSSSSSHPPLSTYSLIRWFVLLGLGSYLVLLAKSTYYLGQQQKYYPYDSTNDQDGPLTLQMHYRHGQPEYPTQRQLPPQQRRTATRLYRRQIGPSTTTSSTTSSALVSSNKWYQQRTTLKHDAQTRRETRADQRRRRTRPTGPLSSSSSSSSSPISSWHSISTLHEPRTYQQQRDSLPSRGGGAGGSASAAAAMDQLCGFQAQNGSLSHPRLYPAKAALNGQSRVLITGILNPLGLALALHLKERCGVEQIAGVDAMYPNTVYNRLMLQERIQLLTTNIPKLVKPLVLSYLGLDPTTKTSNSDRHDETNWMEGFEPTHIVHLASYSMDALYNNALVHPEWKNTYSPYVHEERSSSSTTTVIEDPYLYPIRTSMTAMEQILQSVRSVPYEDRPQLIYATQAPPTSTTNTTTRPSRPLEMSPSDQLLDVLKRMDEILVDTYHTQTGFQLPSIGLQLPNAVYGPWGQAGSVLHDVMERAVERQQEQSQAQQSGSASTASRTSGGSLLPPYASPTSVLDMLYVDDAVEAIVSAMQYRADQPISVTVRPETTGSVASVASVVQSYLDTAGIADPNSNPFLERLLAQQNDGPTKRIADTLTTTAQSLIVPKKQTPLSDGLLRSVAWHLDRLSPFGPPAVESGDDLLKRYHRATCAPDDLTCHKSFHYMPCSSECSTHHQCLPSIFDSVRELVYNVSDGCDVVLYTQSLGYNVQDMDLHAEYMDDKDLDDDELLVCNFAFVPRESNLVATVSGKVPNDQLAKFGIVPRPSETSPRAMTERKLDGLNGRLLYRGWILIWVNGGTEPLSVTDRSLLKLSPSEFFHPGVRYGLFVEENFSVSPNLEDVLFLVDEMKRRQLPDRTLKKEVKVDTPHGVTTKKVKYHIPGEPARRASILFAPLRYPNIDDPIIKQYRNGHRKLSIHDASKFMRYEVGYEHAEKEPASLRRQREYYERIPSYINKNTELRSNYEPWYRFSMRHWVRTRWVVHDFGLEDSRLLRCDWYQEHIQWGNDLDQLSFANVMATRELKRRIAHQEPDDHVRTFIEEHPELHDLTDSYEWHALETDYNRLHREPTDWRSHLPDDAFAAIDAQNGQVVLVDEGGGIPEEETPLYVRIMSERVMAASRKVWSKVRKQVLKHKRAG
jgi:nucleoside-diphosphate-sugar epimerase